MEFFNSIKLLFRQHQNYFCFDLEREAANKPTLCLHYQLYN